MPDFLEIDFGKCNAGMSCEEYSLLAIAGPTDVPSVVAEKMKKHEGACKYHNTSAFIQSALKTPVTSELEEATQKLIEKFTQNTE